MEVDKVITNSENVLTLSVEPSLNAREELASECC